MNICLSCKHLSSCDHAISRQFKVVAGKEIEYGVIECELFEVKK